MKSLNFKSLIFFSILLLFPAIFANAQDVQDRPQMRPQKLLEQLGLSREQVQQLRQINKEKQPLMREAQDKLRDANRALDLAIYADKLSEDDIQARLKDVQTAQAEVFRIRSMTELAVRNVLTAEQLAKFRKLREDFARQMEERRMENEDRPNQRPNQQRNNNPVQRRRNNR